MTRIAQNWTRASIWTRVSWRRIGRVYLQEIIVSNRKRYVIPSKGAQITPENFDFCPKFRFLFRILIFVKNFDFCQKLGFLDKISIFDQNFDFYPKFRFWSKFWFLSKILFFVQKFDFWPKILLWSKNSIFVQKFDFCLKWRFLSKISIFFFKILMSKISFFVQNSDFFSKILTFTNAYSLSKILIFWPKFWTQIVKKYFTAVRYMLNTDNTQY